jgi:drug/metabolite transporter (DMT)-like permease
VGADGWHSAGRASRAAAQPGNTWQRLWAASGLLAVLLFACGLLFGDVLGTSNFPALDATAAHVRAYFLENASEVRALSFFHALSAVALVAFAAYIYAFLRRQTGTPPGLAAFALAGGAIAAAFLLLSALCYRTLAEPTVARDAPLAHALVVLSYLAGGPAIAVPLVPTVGVVAAATLREHLFARWTGWLGVVTAVCGAACASTFLGPTNNRSATYGVLLLGAVLMFAWLVVTSIALIARTREQRRSLG